MTDKEYIHAAIKGLEETIDFFGPERRQEREIWVANEFLTNLGAVFNADELIAPDNDPPDVIFRDAQFEIKEILDPHRRRHAEYKAALEAAKKATSITELSQDYSPRDIYYSEIFELVRQATLKYASKYPEAVKNNLDLLFYVNLEDSRAYIKHDLPDPEILMGTGFRSVSFIAGNLSGVLMAKPAAPEILQGDTPRVVRKDHNQ